MQKVFDLNFFELVNISGDINLNVQHLWYKTSHVDTILNDDAKLNMAISLMNSLNQILNSFRTIYSIIQELATAIAFSKILTLNRSTINITELFEILKVVENHTRLT